MLLSLEELIYYSAKDHIKFINLNKIINIYPK